MTKVSRAVPRGRAGRKAWDHPATRKVSQSGLDTWNWGNLDLALRYCCNVAITPTTPPATS